MATLLCYGIKPAPMDLELSGMHCDHALLTSLLDPPCKLLLLSSLPLLHCNVAC